MSEKNKNWFRRHLVLTIILSIIALIIIVPMVIGFIFGVTGTPVPQSMKDVWSKNSSYTLDDCLDVCEKYCIQAQTDSCQGICQMIGKEGKSMDLVVNSAKDAVIKLNC